MAFKVYRGWTETRMVDGRQQRRPTLWGFIPRFGAWSIPLGRWR